MTASSASTAHHQRMLAEQRAHEPSMEEILASIRRIIADDRALPLTPRPTEVAAPAPAPAPVVPEPAANEAGAPGEETRAAYVAPRVEELAPDVRGADAESVFAELAAELQTETMSVAEMIAPETVVAVEAPQEPAEAAPAQTTDAPVVAAEEEAAADISDAGPLLSAQAGQSVVAAFDQLAETVANSHARIVEEAVRDMLRPMLKTWLDDNLPVIVERLVRTEIERVARGGR